MLETDDVEEVRARFEQRLLRLLGDCLPIGEIRALTDTGRIIGEDDILNCLFCGNSASSKPLLLIPFALSASKFSCSKRFDMKEFSGFSLDVLDK